MKEVVKIIAITAVKVIAEAVLTGLAVNSAARAIAEVVKETVKNA